jgi:transposase-like protein
VVEQRYDAVMEVLRDERTVTEVAERWGVSRQSLYSWLGRYQAGGVEGLADRSHRPRSCPHQIPAAVEVRICFAVRHRPLQRTRGQHHAIAAGVGQQLPQRDRPNRR